MYKLEIDWYLPMPFYFNDQSEYIKMATFFNDHGYTVILYGYVEEDNEK